MEELTDLQDNNIKINIFHIKKPPSDEGGFCFHMLFKILLFASHFLRYPENINQPDDQTRLLS
jgi:hypothetical protein